MINQEQPLHPIYNYALITDAEEGLILVDVNTLQDGEPRNNFLKRALTWNRRRRAARARATSRWAATMPTSPPTRASSSSISTDPLKPRDRGGGPAARARARPRCSSAICSSPMHGGLRVIDVTVPERAQLRRGRASCRWPTRTASTSRAPMPTSPPGSEGLVIVDVEKPEQPRLLHEVHRGRRAQRRARRGRRRRPTRRCSPMSPTARNGLKVIQLTAPDTQPKFYGFSPEPKPQLIAWRKTANAGARRCRAGWNATAPSTRPAARSRSSGASARGRSTSRSSANVPQARRHAVDGARRPNLRRRRHDRTPQLLMLAAALLGCLQAAQRRRHAAARRTRRDKIARRGQLRRAACATARSKPGRTPTSCRTNIVPGLARDKHARSYAVLLNDRSKEIAAKLGAAGTRAQDRPVPRLPYAQLPKPRRRGEGFQITDGIACEACHGPPERWIKTPRRAGGDARRQTWRDGMYPTTRRRRARACACRCHFGNAGQVRHPQDDGGRASAHELRARHLHADRDRRISASTTTGSSRKGGWDGVRALGDRAGGRRAGAARTLLQSPRGRDGLFPELVLFDCHSCHHPWRTGATRPPARGGPGRGAPERCQPADAAADRAPRGRRPRRAGFAQQVGRLHKAVASGNDALAAGARDPEQLVERLICRKSRPPLFRRRRARHPGRPDRRWPRRQLHRLSGRRTGGHGGAERGDGFHGQAPLLRTQPLQAVDETAARGGVATTKSISRPPLQAGLARSQGRRSRPGHER